MFGVLWRRSAIQLPSLIGSIRASSWTIKCQQTKNICNFNFSMGYHNRYYSTDTGATDDIYKDIDYDAITKGDESLLNALKIILLEFEVMRDEGNTVPSKMSTNKWSELLICKTRSQRLKLLRFWFLNEKKNFNDKQRKLAKQAKRALDLANKPRVDDGHIFYGFSGSNLFLRVYDSTIDRWNNAKLIEAMMFGQDLVVDCGYDQHMNLREASNCAKQLMILFAENRLHKSPFNLHFVNANPESYLMGKLKTIIPTVYDKDFPLHISTKSYLDIFPKEKLVYLTPHCREELLEYSHDDIYIIGGMVDKENNLPLSLGKAKFEKLRMGKLPLDRYLDWGYGNKSLTLNQVLKIMLNMKVTNDWEQALTHVPKRKVKTEEERQHLEQNRKYPNSLKFKLKQSLFHENKTEQSNWNNISKVYSRT